MSAEDGPAASEYGNATGFNRGLLNDIEIRTYMYVESIICRTKLRRLACIGCPGGYQVL
ncbi:MAG: hypothetical protein JW837_04210 [Sedimentisphaerales bacterium]|nr:hypothetical protein [Sedimentisphaerales bacterium]